MTLKVRPDAAGHQRVGEGPVACPPGADADGEEHVRGLGLTVGKRRVVGTALEIDVVENNR